MPGYGGKTLAGFMLATLSILSYTKFGTALLVLAVPMTDAAFILLIGAMVMDYLDGTVARALDKML